MPYFCIMADSSIVWAFSWGAKPVSEISSEFVLHKGGGGVGLGFVLLFLETVFSRNHAHCQICKPDSVCHCLTSHEQAVTV